jgi:hypothetical protein
VGERPPLEPGSTQSGSCRAGLGIIQDALSVYYGYWCYANPNVAARYACRCGRIHTQHGAVQVSQLPPGWQETSDLAGEPEPECPRCHEKTVARRASHSTAGPAPGN